MKPKLTLLCSRKSRVCFDDSLRATSEVQHFLCAWITLADLYRSYSRCVQVLKMSATNQMSLRLVEVTTAVSTLVIMFLLTADCYVWIEMIVTCVTSPWRSVAIEC